MRCSIWLFSWERRYWKILLHTPLSKGLCWRNTTGIHRHPKTLFLPSPQSLFFKTISKYLLLFTILTLFKFFAFIFLPDFFNSACVKHQASWVIYIWCIRNFIHNMLTICGHLSLSPSDPGIAPYDWPVFASLFWSPIPESLIFILPLSFHYNQKNSISLKEIHPYFYLQPFWQ